MTTHELVELLLKRLDSQDGMLISLDRKLEDHIQSEAISRPVLEEMAEMWGRSKAVAWFFTKLASLLAVAAGGWTWIKDNVK